MSTPSWKTFANGPILTLQSGNELWDYYTNDRTKAAPIFNDDLSSMPDTLIITAEYDPLVDECAAYAKKLRAAYVEVTEKIYPKMIHGFFQFGGVIEEGRASIAAVAKYIRHKLYSID
jgi:acetyl esterase